MAEISGFYKPELSLKSDGVTVPFTRLNFDSFAGGTLLRIQTSEAPKIGGGDIIESIFSWGQGLEAPLFFCQVIGVYPSKGGTFEILCREKYFKELSAPLKSVTWRNSNVPEILNDLFEITGIPNVDLSSCESLGVSRFSFLNGFNGYIVINNLRTFIRASYRQNYEMIISPAGKLLFGELNDIRPEMPEEISFNSGQNIISKDRGRIEAFALPVVYGQTVIIDGIRSACSRSIITISSGKYRMILEANPI